MWELRLLGPVELWAGGRRVELGPAKQRAVLAALAAEPGRAVPLEELIDRVWDGTPPRTVRNALHTYVLRLRRVFEEIGPDAPRLEFRNGGYALAADPDQVDLSRFRDLVARSRRGGLAPSEVAAYLREALALWTDQPLAGLSGDWAADLRDDLAQQRLAAALALAPVELGLGTAPAAVAELLLPLLDDHPLVEPLAALLIRTLRRDGREAQAQAVFARTRQRLHDELGTAPGAELRQAMQSRPAPEAGRPRQLPMDVRGFTGRRAELARLDELLGRVGQEAVVATLSGTAGVGKSALAVHWAHRVQDRFPDGQLYVNLRGFDPSGPPAPPAEALRGFLEALGVLPQRMPADVAGQSALFRSLLSGRRMLILLDNAADAGQVRPLLPGAAGCLALVTSRGRLGGLVAAEGAHPVRLATLADGEARDLLARRIGSSRVEAEPSAVARILAACAGLPLALAITAARAATDEAFLSTVAEELTGDRRRLDALADIDPATDVRAVFSWSYRTLDPSAARLFRLLALHPGPDAGLAGIAALLGVPADEARGPLTRLVQANLLVEQPAGRYGCHDLLRAYAKELADRHDPVADRRAATRRILDHYLHSALAGDERLYPHRHRFHYRPEPAAPGVVPAELPDVPAALAWFATEERSLRAAVDLTAAQGFDTHAWLLPWALATYFERQWNGRDWLACLEVSLSAAERAGDAFWQARTHCNLGYAYRELGRPEEAHPHLNRALELFGDAGAADERALVHLNLGTTARRLGHYEEALHHGKQALERYGQIDDQPGMASALNNLGWCHVTLGNYAEALAYCRRAVDIQEEAANLPGAAHSWDSLGYVHHHLGEYADAIRCYRRSRELFHRQGDRRLEAIILSHQGDTHHAAGDPAAALEVWRQALQIFTDIDHPDAAEVRAKIHAQA
ncbi:tetratricopeptide repeat protein [Actinoplanes sp. NPDC049548]|uniref:AfsR/SARP family transcriptional regulator n=1 Tax=Actinoplanes sp. NPDC049548 TaxID=3155152 RepID=UPI00341BC955